MTTREEQIEKAREIARLNRQWEAEFPYLKHKSGAFVVYFAADCAWGARDKFGVPVWHPVTGERLRFASLVAAIRALGFDVKEEG